MNDAEKLKLFRDEKKLSQTALANKLGVSQQVIAMVETSYKGKPAPASLKYALLKTYGYDFDTDSYLIVKKSYNHKIRFKAFSEAISTIGKRLSKIQIENDLTDKEISNLLEISERRYEKLIEGKEKPYFDEIMAIAENFDVSLDWLILNENAPVQEEEEDTDTNLTEQELKFLRTILKKAKKTI